MANVQITNPVLNDIYSTIYTLRDLELQNNPLPFSFDTLTRKIPVHPVIDLFWGNHLHLKDQIPVEWMTQGENVTVYLNIKLEDGTYREAHSAYRLRFESSRANRYTLPPNVSSYPSLRVNCDHPVFAAVQDDLASYFDAMKMRKEIQNRWAKVRDDVQAFLDNYKSINAALKDWAGLRRFLSPDIIERLERKVERAPRDKQPMKELQTERGIIDMEALEAASVIGSMLKGG